MIEKKKNYLTILNIELEDLLEDIQLITTSWEQEKRRDCVSEYVFLENLAFFQNEVFGVGAFSRILKQTDLNNFPDVDSMMSHLKTLFADELRANGVSQAILDSVLRKMDKVKAYVDQQA